MYITVVTELSTQISTNENLCKQNVAKMGKMATHCYVTTARGLQTAHYIQTALFYHVCVFVYLGS